VKTRFELGAESMVEAYKTKARRKVSTAQELQRKVVALV
jgi:hypothetical protein